MPATIVGAIAGGQKDVSNQQTNSGLNLSPETALEKNGNSSLNDAFNWLKDAVNKGPGQDDISNAYTNNKSLADMLDAYSKGGYQPNSSDISSSNDLASKLYQGQQTALNQSFDTQNQNYNKQAALMGRDPNDPVFRSKLAYQQSRDQQQLSANQNSWASQYAMSMPGQRLGFAQQKNSLLNGLATQAMANRQAIASMGEGIMNDERNFRIQTAGHFSNSQQESGGGLKGALMGGMAGFGQDASLYGALYSPSTPQMQAAPMSSTPMYSGAQYGGQDYGSAGSGRGGMMGMAPSMMAFA